MATKSLADELRSYSKPVPVCSMSPILAALSPADRKALEATLAERRADGKGFTVPGTHIAEVLTARGHEVEADAVRRHRNGTCKCGKGKP